MKCLVDKDGFWSVKGPCLLNLQDIGKLSPIIKLKGKNDLKNNSTSSNRVLPENYQCSQYLIHEHIPSPQVFIIMGMFNITTFMKNRENNKIVKTKPVSNPPEKVKNYVPWPKFGRTLHYMFLFLDSHLLNMNNYKNEVGVPFTITNYPPNCQYYLRRIIPHIIQANDLTDVLGVLIVSVLY